MTMFVALWTCSNKLSVKKVYIGANVGNLNTRHAPMRSNGNKDDREWRLFASQISASVMKFYVIWYRNFLVSLVHY